ncbi:MAG: tRNA (guanine-N7)-methyltransferase, partial [Deltaproteobacteria bacterium]|nr:tRNA (guanine-N7)-methyltransferase [Deltaproteobacteria bacterium]
MTLIRSPLFTSAARLDKITDLRELFDPSQPLCLEIGCGIGDFVVQLAARHPDKNFMAIDIFNQGCLKTCTRLENAGLSNVRVVRTEARSLLLKHLPPQSLSALYINCPDPWP